VSPDLSQAVVGFGTFSPLASWGLLLGAWGVVSVFLGIAVGKALREPREREVTASRRLSTGGCGGPGRATPGPGPSLRKVQGEGKGMTDSFAYEAPRKRGRIRRHPWLATIVTFALFASAGAVAQWLVSGAGTGYVKVGTLTAPSAQVPADGEITGVLFPGTTAALTFKLDNQSGGALTLTGFSPLGPFTVTGSQGSCTSDTGTALFSAVSGLSITVPTGVTIVSIPNAVTIPASASNGCQGATLAQPGTLSFTS
jgi:hypothetical protein